MVDADSAWPQQFRDIATYLGPFVGASVLRIEHVGSTAVPSLAAKPIIDIDVVVAEASQVPGVLQRIESAGYQWVGDLTVSGREAFEPIRTPPLPVHLSGHTIRITSRRPPDKRCLPFLLMCRNLALRDESIS